MFFPRAQRNIASRQLRGLFARYPNAKLKWFTAGRGYTSAPPQNGYTQIEKLLLDNIKAAGPITFASYMQMCLSHPTHGYYMNPANPIFGTQGDFVTSPEISQVFGELLGVWLLSQWMQAGQDQRIRLVELGPGRGTLMEDILRTFSRFSSCAQSIQSVHLIETSKPLCSLQENRLKPVAERLGADIHWHEGLDLMPAQNDAFTMVVAHEFFDALPFHVLQNTADGWKEVLIASSPDHSAAAETPSSPTPSSNAPRFQTFLSPTPLSRILSISSPRFTSLPSGTTLEVSPVAWSISRQIAQLVGSSGCALIVDYGADHFFGKSFRVRLHLSSATWLTQAFKAHTVVDPFLLPGECDLTANVDFAYLREAAQDLAAPLGPITQAEFLLGMGLEQRVDVLARAAGEDGERIREAAGRLVDMAGMGGEYKVFGMVGREREMSAEGVWPFVRV
ncbi:DUF185-domain-containing protein [Heliocybe sulcata]|uniref:Protein arginine methyltransferase NDUFAF7 n=1 Tax=Heliocybe sulcata TaxID=5364 RepID=A0A5C3MMX1_9AGAM|nr:DUF185-domain-containing protein [Heliocybe sulcata]